MALAVWIHMENARDDSLITLGQTLHQPGLEGYEEIEGPHYTNYVKRQNAWRPALSCLLSLHFITEVKHGRGAFPVKFSYTTVKRSTLCVIAPFTRCSLILLYILRRIQMCYWHKTNVTSDVHYFVLFDHKRYTFMGEITLWGISLKIINHNKSMLVSLLLRRSCITTVWYT